MLFQHHLPPPPSTYTSDAPQTVTEPGEDGGVDHKQLVNTFVGQGIKEPCYIVGTKPGPYVAEHSHNIFARLGARIALLGIDARVERTRHQVNYPETYDLVFGRLKEELTAAASSGKPFKHVILLLGIPIAYPVGQSIHLLLLRTNLYPAIDMAGEHFLKPFDGSYQVR